jgi:putative glutathione S-transferase
MGMLVEGRWRDRWFDTDAHDGRFVRQDSAFRGWVCGTGQEPPAGRTARPAEVGRYHLYVAMACPWAHRVLIMRHLKGLEKFVSLSVAHWRMAGNGWSFEPDEGVVPDPVNCVHAIHELYTLVRPAFTGRATVPILWDIRQKDIVNNESSDIIRILNAAFDTLGAAPGDYYPDGLRREIDEMNERTYAGLNNGVYRAGFATTQAAYEEAAWGVFETLDWLDAHLEGRDFLVGGRLTEADVRLYPTLVRFDPVYHGLFKCNLRRLADYPRLTRYLQHLQQRRAFRETLDMRHIKNHYYNLLQVNPSGIVPVGPAPAQQD